MAIIDNSAINRCQNATLAHLKTMRHDPHGRPVGVLQAPTSLFHSGFQGCEAATSSSYTLEVYLQPHFDDHT